MDRKECRNLGEIIGKSDSIREFPGFKKIFCLETSNNFPFNVPLEISSCAFGILPRILLDLIWILQ